MKVISQIFVLTALHTAVDVLSFLVQPPVRAYNSKWNPNTLLVNNNDNNGLMKTRISDASPILAMSQTDSENSLCKVPEDDDTAIPFVEVDDSSFIECYADSTAVVNGVKYTIGSPCDNAVSLCYFDTNDQLVPIELDEDLMDEIFPLAAR
jgi:hypothetical protein